MWKLVKVSRFERMFFFSSFGMSAETVLLCATECGYLTVARDLIDMPRSCVVEMSMKLMPFWRDISMASGLI